jgi:hypothetical protein
VRALGGVYLGICVSIPVQQMMFVNVNTAGCATEGPVYKQLRGTTPHDTAVLKLWYVLLGHFYRFFSHVYPKPLEAYVEIVLQSSQDSFRLNPCDSLSVPYIQHTSSFSIFFWLSIILRYVRVLISLWLIQFHIFLFAAEPEEFFLEGLKKLEERSHKCVELGGDM